MLASSKDLFSSETDPLNPLELLIFVVATELPFDGVVITTAAGSVSSGSVVADFSNGTTIPSSGTSTTACGCDSGFGADAFSYSGIGTTTEVGGVYGVSVFSGTTGASAAASTGSSGISFVCGVLSGSGAVLITGAGTSGTGCTAGFTGSGAG